MNHSDEMPESKSRQTTNSHPESTLNKLNTKCGFIALIGAPNAGKSTLLNQLVGSKVSIVTHKVQTTRSIIRGIAIHNESQLIFVDTPGLFTPKRRLERAMVETAWGGANDADLVAMLIDAKKGLDDENSKILQKLTEFKFPTVLILNKIDQVKRELLLELTKSINGVKKFNQTFMISALKGDGIQKLLDYFAETVQTGPFLYPEDQISDLPLRMLAAEITREKLFLRLHEELPYASTVETTKLEQFKNGSVRIEQTIFVQRGSQKSIVLGKGGQTIKSISQVARNELATILGKTVHLFLFVKVRQNWSDDPERYREMGLDFPK